MQWVRILWVCYLHKWNILMLNMKRSAERHLKEWHVSPYRKPLIVRGARQVGKSTMIRHFARICGLTLHEVNLERHITLSSFFATKDPERIVQELTYICGNGPIAGEKSLLFLDEIQAVPEAIAALRYFYEELPELPVIGAGSLLEFALSEHSFSMPVGRILRLPPQY